MLSLVCESGFITWLPPPRPLAHTKTALELPEGHGNFVADAWQG